MSLIRRDREYECPNGHPFRWPRAIGCDECDASVVMVPTAEVYALRDQLARAVHLTDEERERVLWWLHKPVPPGPAKELDERIIRKLNGGAGEQ
jgi:hypothetical protein